MDFSQIEKVLGKNHQINETWIDNEEILAYEISYIIGNICIKALSYDVDGSGSDLVFSEVTNNNLQEITVEDSKIGVFSLGMDYEDLMKLDLYNSDFQITETTEVKDGVNAWD